LTARTPVALREEAAPSAVPAAGADGGDSRGLLGLLRRVPTAVWAVLALAVALRIWLWIGYRPARMELTDTVGYLWQLQVGLFNDPIHPAGYGIFLEAIRALTTKLEVTIAIQHLLGIGTGITLYATVRRFGLPVWPAVVAAAAVLLSLDQIFLEHALMSETLFTFLLSLSLYACARAYGPSRPVWRGLDTRSTWLIAAGLLLGLSACVRTAGVPLLAVLAVWAALALRGALATRIGNAALVAGAAAAVLLGYATLNYTESDEFALSSASGWAAYARSAPFADCEQFTPPAGTERLCEETPPQSRPGPDYYAWDPGSPARTLFGGHPTGNEELGAFGRRAILAQPFDYLETVGYDALRFFVPETPLVPDWFEQREWSGLGYEITDVAGRAGDFEQVVLESTRTFYPSTNLTVTGAIDPLGEVQDVIRVHPGVLLAALILALVGLGLARGPARAGLWLFLSVALVMVLMAAATTTYTARYAVPVQGPLVAAGAIGLWALVAQWRARHDGAGERDSRPA